VKEKLIRAHAVAERLGINRTHIYRLIAVGKFPAPVFIVGARAVAWKESVIDDWIAKCAAAGPGISELSQTRKREAAERRAAKATEGTAT
jgi:prophage regulatory protein